MIFEILKVLSWTFTGKLSDVGPRSPFTTGNVPVLCHILLEAPNWQQLSDLFAFVLFVALKKRIPWKMCILSRFLWSKSVLFNLLCIFYLFFSQNGGSPLCFRSPLIPTPPPLGLVGQSRQSVLGSRYDGGECHVMIAILSPMKLAQAGFLFWLKAPPDAEVSGGSESNWSDRMVKAARDLFADTDRAESGTGRWWLP